MFTPTRKLWTILCTVALLVMLVVPTAVRPVQAATGVSVNWTDTRQTIDGFGASGAFRRATYLMNMSEPNRSAILDALFSQTNGAGLSIVRNIVGDGSTLSDGVPTIEPSLNNWVWTGDEGQIWLMQAAKARGANRFMSTVWSPPGWMKDNGSFIGGSLATAHYHNYANYLSRYIREYKSRFGLDIYAISLANEPCIAVSYSSACWTGAQFRDFIKNNLTSTFQADGVNTNVMIGEHETWDESVANESLNDSTSAARVDIVGGHHYGGTIAPFSNALSRGKKVWETEVSYFSGNDSSITDGIRWAKEAHSFLATANVNAFLYWWFVTEKSDGEGLVQINTSNNTYTINKRLFTLGNYARFVRPGWVRIGSTANPTTNVFTTAFKDPATGKFAIVVINDNSTAQTIDILPNGFSASTVTPYVTDATRNLAQLSAVSLNGVSLPARSVTTFTGTSGSVGPTNTPGTPATATATSTATIPGSGPDGWARIEAESYNTSGGSLQVCSGVLCYVGANAWTQYNGVNLHTGTNRIDLSVANGGGNTNLQVWVGGVNLGTLAIASTGGWDIYQTRSLTLPAQNGVKDVKLVFVNGNLNLDWLTFAGTTTATNTPTLTFTPTRTNTPTLPVGPTNTPSATPTRTNTPPASTNIFNNADLEAGTSGWLVNGAGTLSSDTSQFHGGSRSIKITGRTAAWNGVGQNLALANFPTSGQNYTVSIWVRSQSGTPTAKATLRLTAATTTYLNLASATVNANGWTLLTATVPVSWSGTLTGVLFYVETAAGTDNLYVDDASLVR